MKKIFHYLKEDNQERLRSKGNGTIKIVVYCELEWGGDHEKKQSKSGYPYVKKYTSYMEQLQTNYDCSIKCKRIIHCCQWGYKGSTLVVTSTLGDGNCIEGANVYILWVTHVKIVTFWWNITLFHFITTSREISFIIWGTSSPKCNLSH